MTSFLHETHADFETFNHLSIDQWCTADCVERLLPGFEDTYKDNQDMALALLRTIPNRDAFLFLVIMLLGRGDFLF